MNWLNEYKEQSVLYNGYNGYNEFQNKSTNLAFEPPEILLNIKKNKKYHIKYLKIVQWKKW